MGDFSCPIDVEGYLDYDCRKCIKYCFHDYFLKRFGSRATCRVASTLRFTDPKDLTLSQRETEGTHTGGISDGC